MVVNHFVRRQIARMWRERRTSRDNRNQNNRRDSCYRPTISVHAPTRARLRPPHASRKAALTHGSSRCGARWYKALSRIAVRNTRRFACSRACCATIECTSSSRLLQVKFAVGVSVHQDARLFAGQLTTLFAAGRWAPATGARVHAPAATSSCRLELPRLKLTRFRRRCRGERKKEVPNAENPSTIRAGIWCRIIE
jgi:hypothetical protein